MNRHQVIIVLVFSVFVSQALGQQSECNPFSPNTVGPDTPATIRFGMNFSPDGQTAPYTLKIMAAGWNAGTTISPFNTNLFLLFPHNQDTGPMSPMMINGAYVMGGKGYKTYNETGYVQTAYFECSADNSTATWGPAYPDYLSTDENKRFSAPDLEITMEYYAPRNSSFIRIMTTISGQDVNDYPLHLNVHAAASAYLAHLGPSVKGRYVAGYPWRDDDPGANFIDPNYRSSYNQPPYSSHARGPQARDKKFFIHSRPGYQDFGFRWPGFIQGTQKFKIMHVINFAPNKTKMLEMAQWIDSEPAEIFAGIKVSDLPYIVNWGACPVMLGPKVNVSIQVLNKTRDYTTIEVFANTVQAEGTDISFYHRISYADGDGKIIPTQSSTTIAIPTGACSQKLKHQLWYIDLCVVKETLFNC